MKKRIEYTPIVKTVPELSKRDGNVYTCSVGYSPQLGFIRVYPLPLYSMKRWHRYEIEVEKNKRDSRAESWKLSSYTRFDNFIGFEKEIICKGKNDSSSIIAMMQKQITPSLSRLNEQRASIGFLMVNNVRPYWDVNDRYINTKQIGMFADVEIADFSKYMKETKERESRITFKDGDGTHDLQLNDWQYYEYQRQHGANSGAFRFIEVDKKSILVVGNMFSYRSKWICLGVYKPVNQFMLF